MSGRGRSLALLLAGVGTAPCEYGCEFVQKCASEKISCSAFVMFALNGRSRRREESDIPSKEKFKLDGMVNVKAAVERLNMLSGDKFWCQE